MTRIHMIRHAAYDGVGRRLVGRREGVLLNDEGRAQANRLAAALRAEPVAAVYTSPLERAHETAALVAEPHGIRPMPQPAFAELDFGDWTGSDVEGLESNPRWRDFNLLRSLTRVPGGELMLETQARAVAGLLDVQRRHESETAVIVSHGDVIRALIGHLLGIPMDYLQRLEIGPASVSTVELHGSWPHVLCVGASPC